MNMSATDVRLLQRIMHQGVIQIISGTIAVQVHCLLRPVVATLRQQARPVEDAKIFGIIIKHVIQ